MPSLAYKVDRKLMIAEGYLLVAVDCSDKEYANVQIAKACTAINAARELLPGSKNYA